MFCTLQIPCGQCCSRPHGNYCVFQGAGTSGNWQKDSDTFGLGWSFKKKVHPISEFLPFFPHFFKWNFQRPPPAATPRWTSISSPQICEATDSFGTMDAENRHLGCFGNGLGSRWVAEVSNKWLGVLDGEADISWFGAPRCGRGMLIV